jgi:cytochrome P450
MTSPVPLDFAPDTPDFYLRDPHAAFAHLRAHDPVHWYAEGRFWCLTRQAEIREVSRTPRVFSSARGTQLFQIPIMHAGGSLKAPGTEEQAASIIQMDPPEHNRHRKLVMSAFKPRYVEGLEPRIREIARASLDACDPTATVDFVEQIAVPLPMLVIAEMIGIPGSDRAAFRRWSDSIIAVGGGGYSDEGLADLAELFAYFTTSLAEHRATPRDDIITMLQQAELDGERLGEGEILMFLLTLLVAGNETTRNLIAGGGRALAEHPDQRAWLAADPSRIPGAVEEMLRWVTPVRNFIRCAVADTTLGDTPIRQGDYLALFYGSANRDEEVFGDTADCFDVARPDASRHIAFGFGEHLCLGASLARLEGRVMFEELLRRWPRWEIAGEIVPLQSCLMNGLVHMPVRL